MVKIRKHVTPKPVTKLHGNLERITAAHHQLLQGNLLPTSLLLLLQSKETKLNMEYSEINFHSMNCQVKKL